MSITANEFINLKKGDRIKCRLGDTWYETSCTSNAYYNSDCEEKGWEVRTQLCILSIDNDVEFVVVNEPKVLNTREKMLLGMNEIVMNFNNENAIERWLMCGVPDGADDEYVMDMANDDDQFKYCLSLFLDIMSRKSAYEDGVYVSKELGVINKDTRRNM